jgi:hypothetical protein
MRARLTRGQWWRGGAVVWCVLLLTWAGACAGNIRPEDLPKFDTIEDQFKYGSVGIESEEGIPYWIWQALPRVFADKLPRPGGYAGFGFQWEPGRELPVGFSKVDGLYGGPRIAINSTRRPTSSSCRRSRPIRDSIRGNCWRRSTA